MSDDTKSPIEQAWENELQIRQGFQDSERGESIVRQQARVPSVEMESYDNYTDYISDVKLRRETFGQTMEPVPPDPSKYSNQEQFNQDFKTYAYEVERYIRAASRNQLNKFAMGVGMMVTFGVGQAALLGGGPGALAGGTAGAQSASLAAAEVGMQTAFAGVNATFAGAVAGGGAGLIGGTRGNREELLGGVLSGISGAMSASSVMDMIMSGASFLINERNIVVQGPEGTIQLPLEQLYGPDDTPSDSLYRRRSNIIGSGLQGITLD